MEMDDKSKRILAALGVAVAIAIVVAILTTRQDPTMPTEPVQAGSTPMHRASDEPELPINK